MLKRLTRIGVLAVLATGLLATLGPEAEAHYIVVSGKLRYHSISCESIVKNVQNLEQNPALATCTVVGTVVETECENPVGKVVGGTASHPIVFGPVSGELAQSGLEKKKGRAHFDELISDSPTLGLTSEEAGCNNNWEVRRALIHEADVTIDVYPCGSDGCQEGDINDLNKASTALFSCVLPPQFDLDNPPPAEPPTIVECSLESFTHSQ